MRPTIYPIPALKDNYIWAIINNSQQTTIIIDPGEAQPVLDFLAQHRLSLNAILITHHHWDHTNGIAEILHHFPVPVYGTSGIPSISYPVTEGSLIQINDFPFNINVLAIPGHTLDHIAFHFNETLFCGDTLFSAGCGKLFEGTAAQMYSSLQKLAGLSETTLVYCAHEYTLNNLRFAHTVEPLNEHIINRTLRVTKLREQSLPSLPSTLKEEKETNPFLRCHIPTVKDSIATQTGISSENPITVFAALRKWKDHF
jgi:hydroxyacylglutathione hydrolase